MNYSITISLVLALLLAFVISLAVAGSLNYSGFCVSKAQHLSDQDLITSAVDRINHNEYINLRDDAGVYYGAKAILYADSADFLSQNPNCCNITVGLRGGEDTPPPTVLSRMLGLYRGDVNITYKARYFNHLGSQEQIIIKTRIPMTNCGLVSD